MAPYKMLHPLLFLSALIALSGKHMHQSFWMCPYRGKRKSESGGLDYDLTFHWVTWRLLLDKCWFCIQFKWLILCLYPCLLFSRVIQSHFFLIIYYQYLMMTNCNQNEINELIIAIKCFQSLTGVHLWTKTD